MAPAMMIASLVVAAAGAAFQIKAANDASKMAKYQHDATMQAAKANLMAEQTELNRQQDEARKDAVAQQGDRTRRANDELGTIRVLAGEMGASANTFNALLAENAYAEGIDLSRIDLNFQNAYAAGEAGKKAAHQNYMNAATGAGLQLSNAKMNARNSKIAAGIDFASSALQIASSAYGGGAAKAAIKTQDIR